MLPNKTHDCLTPLMLEPCSKEPLLLSTISLFQGTVSNTFAAVDQPAGIQCTGSQNSALLPEVKPDTFLFPFPSYPISSLLLSSIPLKKGCFHHYYMDVTICKWIKLQFKKYSHYLQRILVLIPREAHKDEQRLHIHRGRKRKGPEWPSADSVA